MDYNQLIDLWNNNENLGTKVTIDQEAIKELSAYKLQDQLKEIKWTSILEIVITFFWMIFLIGFSVDHSTEFRFLFPGFLLIMVSIFSLVFETYKLKVFFSVKHQFSVVKAQLKVEKLKVLELVDMNSLYLLIPLFFVPFIIVIAKALLGMDIIEMGFGFNEMVLLTMGSLIISILVVYLLKKFPSKELKDSINFLNELNGLKK